MSTPSQAESLQAIEQALLTLRAGARGGPRPPWAGGGAPWGDGPPPWARGGPNHGGPGHRRGGPDGPHAHGMHAGARIRLLEALAGAEARWGISEIADAIGVDQPRASRLVADAASRGLVTRDVDPKDARKSVVAITDAGRELLTQVHAGRRSAVEQALADFTAEDAATLAALLSRFAAAWPR
ncbi:MarR family winged helix-turn-helix transcriptional regulator [Antiquaquibacter oligotrophicus]|nr:MarR family winged helix-turn-helix transcriptional regulator [Antiquaquibacter oligotrophicus]